MDIQELKDTFDFFDDWEDKYRFVIDLGKELPELPTSERVEANPNPWLSKPSLAYARAARRRPSFCHGLRRPHCSRVNSYRFDRVE